MFLAETFVIGSNPGENPEEIFIQDSVFFNSYVPYILFNGVPQILQSGFYTHDSDTRRITFGSTLHSGDVIIVHFYKY